MNIIHVCYIIFIEYEIRNKKTDAIRWTVCEYNSILKYPVQTTGCQLVEDYYNLSPQENKIYF